MPNKPVPLSIGLDSAGKLVEIRVAGKKVKPKKNQKHRCPPGTKEVVIRLKFCKHVEKKEPEGGGATPPCCAVIGGRVVCWPPCV